MYINLRLCEIFNTSDLENGWFGKKHILLFGDWLQLPPVKENPAFIKLTKAQINQYLGSLSNYDLWKNIFSYDQLSENMRQKDDLVYSQRLSKLRQGYLTEDDIKKFNSRKINITGSSCEDNLLELCNYLEKYSLDIVCILSTKNMCRTLNEEKLRRILLDEIKLVATDPYDGPRYIEQRVKYALNANDKDCSQTGSLPKVISIKIGAKIMMSRNIDVSKGLINRT